VGGCFWPHQTNLKRKSQDRTKSATDKYFSFRVLASDIFPIFFKTYLKLGVNFFLGFAPIRFLLHVGRCLWPHQTSLGGRSQDRTKSATDKCPRFRVLSPDIFGQNFEILDIFGNLGSAQYCAYTIFTACWAMSLTRSNKFLAKISGPDQIRDRQMSPFLRSGPRHFFSISEFEKKGQKSRGPELQN
jgi:hypothetical protein